MTPKVSVIMPAFNTAPFIAEAVKSVLNQTIPSLELLVVDDDSNDATPDILASFRDPRLKIIRQEKAGVVTALNRGIAQAQSPLIARMDSDDVCLPQRLKWQLEFLQQHTEISLLGSFVATMDEDGNTLAPLVRCPLQHEEIWQNLGRKPGVMCHPAVVFRREAAEDVGLYNPDFPHAQDVEFFARMMTRYQAANMPRVTLKYRLRRGAVSFVRRNIDIIHAKLVARMIDQWRPGQPLRPSAGQLTAVQAEIAVDPCKGDDIETVYQIRAGLECLRGGKWASALRHCGAALVRNPMSGRALTALAAAALHYGAIRPMPGEIDGFTLA
jgi:glycosyltransferase involved in cell wall biosynthesis